MGRRLRILLVSRAAVGCASTTPHTEDDCIRGLNGTWEIRWVKYRMVIELAGTRLDDLMVRARQRVVAYSTVGDACHLRIIFPNPTNPGEQFTVDSRDGVLYSGEFKWSAGFP